VSWWLVNVVGHDVKRMKLSLSHQLSEAYVGCGPQGRAVIDEARILTIVNHAELMRIKGIGGEYSELLEAAGVDSVPVLAGRNATAPVFTVRCFT
jgi:hypothetical protein